MYTKIVDSVSENPDQGELSSHKRRRGVWSMGCNGVEPMVGDLFKFITYPIDKLSTLNCLYVYA